MGGSHSGVERHFSNRILMLGCGSVGQGLLPLLFSTFAIDPSQVTIIAADEDGWRAAAHFGVRHLVEPLTPANHQAILARHLQADDMLLNLSVNVSSLALIAWCKAQNVLYLDTCVEPWGGGYVADNFPSLETTNAWLRREALAMHSPGAATAVIAHGMNPGLISHLLKQALLALARSKGVTPTSVWGDLAQALCVKVVHVSERDTQDDGQPLPAGVFANTWSAEGLYSEACLQRAELGWGSHEPRLPKRNVMVPGARTLCLDDHGADIWLKSWIPTLGEQQGMLVTHHEVVSMTEMLASATYRPTVCYVYNVCPKARASLAKWRAGQAVCEFQVLPREVVDGLDEVGVLLVHDTGALWHGSTLSSEGARKLAPYNNATTLQVAAGIVGAMVWMLDHPREGVVEAEDMDYEEVLAVARPWLGNVATVETDWRPGPRLTFDEFLLPNGQEDSHECARAGNICAGKHKEVRT